MIKPNWADTTTVITLDVFLDSRALSKLSIVENVKLHLLYNIFAIFKRVASLDSLFF